MDANITKGDDGDSRGSCPPIGVWRRTSEALPCPPGEQTSVLMWSPGWSTWLHGLFTHYHQGAESECSATAWACYDANDDRYYDWGEDPVWWGAITTP
jgi:hypothetical protein